jgi:hypothetical protein
MNTNEVLKSALEALENIYHGDTRIVQYKVIQSVRNVLAQPEQGQGIKGYAMALNEVSLKLRKRYEQDLIATPLWAEFEKARNRLARSVAQPEQEPLEYWNAVEGWVKIDEVRKHFETVSCGTIYKTAGEGRVPLYTAPPKRELKSTTDMMMELADRLGELPDDVDPRAWEHLLVYAPKREWVGLTLVEVNEIEKNGDFWEDHTPFDFSQAIEAKLKEKNQ